MTNLSEITKKIDRFFHSANQSLNLLKSGQDQGGYSMPDDDFDDEEGPPTDRNPQTQFDLYNQLVHVADNVPDVNIRSEALMIAEMYQKALELGDGFNYVKRAISNLVDVQLSDADEDDEPTILTELNDVLDEVYKDLTQKSKTGGTAKKDGQDAEKALLQVKRDFDQSFQDLMGSETGFMPAQKGPGGGGSSLREVVEFGGDKDDRSKSTGYQMETRNYKDWVATFTNEKERYIEELSTDIDRRAAEKKEKLISVLDQIIEAIGEQKQAMERNDALGTPESAAALAAATDKVMALRRERSVLKSSLKSNILQRQTDQLLNDFQTVAKKGDANIQQIMADPTKLANRDNREKYRLFQELVLKRLQNDQLIPNPEKQGTFLKFTNKGEEVFWRKKLIEFLPGMTTSQIGIQTYQNILNKIDEASKKKVSLSQAHKEEAAGRKVHKEEYDYKGVMIRFYEGLSNVKMGIKKNITAGVKRELTSNENTKYKPYVNDIATAKEALDAAKQKGDPTMIQVAEQRLKLHESNLQKKLNDDAINHPLIVSYEKNEPKYRAFAKAFADLIGSTPTGKAVKGGKDWMNTDFQLTPEIKDRMSALANMGRAILREDAGRKEFASPQQWLGMLVKSLEDRVTRG